MKIKYLIFSGLALVFTAVVMRLSGVDFYFLFLIGGISLKVTYLIIGLLNGSLAAGRYLWMLFFGIAMVGGGSYLKNVFPEQLFGYWILWTGFLLKVVSIVFMVVVGRKRRLTAEMVRDE